MKPNSIMHKIMEANLVVANGLIIKDRTGISESKMPENLSRFREIFWDQELRLLEISSMRKTLTKKDI